MPVSCPLSHDHCICRHRLHDHPTTSQTSIPYTSTDFAPLCGDPSDDDASKQHAPSQSIEDLRAVANAARQQMAMEDVADRDGDGDVAMAGEGMAGPTVNVAVDRTPEVCCCSLHVCTRM